MLPTGTVVSRFALSRPLPWVIGIAALLIAGLVAWDWRIARQHGAAPQPTAAPVIATPAPTPAPQASRPATPPGPSFDIVRINPRGDAVMAGRATPGADVVLRWPTVPGRSYQVEAKGSLDAVWTNAGPVAVASGAILSVTNTLPPWQHFFRVRVE